MIRDEETRHKMTQDFPMSPQTTHPKGLIVRFQGKVENSSLFLKINEKLVRSEVQTTYRDRSIIGSDSRRRQTLIINNRSQILKP